MHRPSLSALIFDVDGTLAETEFAHLHAFNAAFAASHLDWHWDARRYTELLNVAGGRERLLQAWCDACGPVPQAERAAVRARLDRVHALKTCRYVEWLRARPLPLRPGVQALITAARVAGLQLGIATTTSPENIEALLAPVFGRDWRGMFAAIGNGATAPRKKPDPQVYRQVLDILGIDPAAALAFEDSADGLAAANAAGIATVITPATFTRHHDFTGAALVLPGLAGVQLADLRRLHAATAPQPEPAA
ncbi:MAG: HAD family hydrolase [Nevskiaceae bacterium]|nr:MAG: HAD family hydrolase [Nevskiaceae bacterium]TBR73705.1 MAG: HAD family hydrolase [Nevskiaceae bacterium]